MAGLLLALTCGCLPHARKVSDPDPADKIPAIAKAVQEHDASVAPQLIADLDNDDPAIRFYAIGGLRSLTGQDLGYHYYEDCDARKPAVQRWRAWLNSQAKR
jgi:hypothetical protein